MDKQQLCNAIRRFIRTRPGFDWRNYDNAAAYRADLRTAARQRADALRLLDAVESRHTCTLDAMLAALHSRITVCDDGSRIDYTPGQYYPTEYRGAVARWLADVLWHVTRDDCAGSHYTGHELRYAMRQRFGRGIASRYFN